MFVMQPTMAVSWVTTAETDEASFPPCFLQVLQGNAMISVWPAWVDNMASISHLLLSINASMNLLLYCCCDKHFWVITQKTLKIWFVWPFTMRRELARMESFSALGRELRLLGKRNEIASTIINNPNAPPSVIPNATVVVADISPIRHLEQEPKILTSDKRNNPEGLLETDL